ncbi:IS256 family transposase [Clostridium sp.]|uniref:IS256 family transposase n=1 Tax=Clostridium sp. TaxID=1506 RepID=UPI003991E959
MSEMSKEFLRNYVKEQNFSNSTEVLTALKSLFKDVLQEALAAELDDMLGYEKNAINSSNNSRNGYSKKTINSELGPITLDIPRDRNGEFEPKIVPKHQRNINGIEDKIISLYAAGMTTRDISEQIKNLYDVEISAETVSNITNRILPLVNEWQNRPLEKTYSFIFMDAIHYKVREDKQVVVKAAYVVIGVNLDGYKEVLGIWIGANESSKFWLSVLNDLKHRGVQNVLIFCVDGLNGFKEAIGAAFPFSKIQRCIIHQIRSSMKYIPYKDRKAFVADLKTVYTAVNADVAMENLIELREKWEHKYPNAIKSWEDNWDNLSTFFEFSPYIRKIIYTTNIIESLNSQFRKVTKTKLIFPNDESLMKMLYLATEKIHSKWTRNYANWDLVINELNIIFDNILSQNA